MSRFEDWFDTRPVLLIHFPGSEAGEVRPEPFSELGIHGILKATLLGNINTRADLDHWLDRHGSATTQDLSSSAGASGL